MGLALPTRYGGRMELPADPRRQSALQRAFSRTDAATKTTAYKHSRWIVAGALNLLLVAPDWLVAAWLGKVLAFVAMGALGFAVPYLAMLLWNWAVAPRQQRDEAYELLAKLEQAPTRPLVYAMHGVLWRHSPALGSNEPCCEACFASTGQVVTARHWVLKTGERTVICPSYNASQHTGFNLTEQQWRQGSELNIASILSPRPAAGS